MDFWISEWISGFQIGFLDFTVDFWISQWISGFQLGFLDFWISVWISADGVRDFFRDGPLDGHTLHGLLLANAFSSVNVTNQTSMLMKQACCQEWGS